LKWKENVAEPKGMNLFPLSLLKGIKSESNQFMYVLFNEKSGRNP